LGDERSCSVYPNPTLESSTVTIELTGEPLGVGSKRMNLSVSDAFQCGQCFKPDPLFVSLPGRAASMWGFLSHSPNLTLTLSAVRFGYTNETYNNPQNLWIYSLVTCFSAARRLLKSSILAVPRGCSSPCSVATRSLGSCQPYIEPTLSTFPRFPLRLFHPICHSSTRSWSFELCTPKKSIQGYLSLVVSRSRDPDP